VKDFQRNKTTNLNSANYQLTKSDIAITIENPNSGSQSTIRFKTDQNYYMILYLNPNETKVAQSLFSSDYSNGDSHRFEINDDLGISSYAFKPQADRMKAGYHFLYTKFKNELDQTNEKIIDNQLEMTKSKDGDHKNVLIQFGEYLERIAYSMTNITNSIDVVLTQKYKDNNQIEQEH
jgi:hypothetical protein